MPEIEARLMNFQSSNRICVVGGGLAGIAAAALLRRRGQKVIIVESTSELGGLLRSRHREGMGWFDFGAHVLEDTGDPMLDEVLFRGLESGDGWISYPACPSAAYFCGRLSKSGFIDTRSLGDELYQCGLRELLALPRGEANAVTLDQHVLRTFGEVFANHVFAPIFKKFFGAELRELTPMAQQLVGMKRLVCGAPEEAVKLKSASAWNDERLAFHDPWTGARPVRHLYPITGGIGVWVRRIAAELAEQGVEIHLGEAIESLKLANQEVKAICLADGTMIDVDSVIWTAPPISLIKLIGSEIPTGIEAPRFCKTLLIDMVVDRLALQSVFYVNCYDPAMKTFRVTLYDGLENQPGRSPSRLTVEVMIPPGAEDESEISTDQITAELVGMGILSAGTSVLQARRDLVSPGFPVLTPGFMESQAKLNKAASKLASNITLLGRAGGKAFFMNDVLRDVRQSVDEIASSTNAT